MRAMLMSTVGLLALAVSSGVGFAADLLVEEPAAAAPAAAFDWSGFYVGAAGSLGVISDSSANGIATFDPSQGSAGAFAVLGYNWVNNNVVYGIEGDIGVLRAVGTLTEGGTDYDAWSLNIDGVASLRGRLGFATENLLLYGTAGLAAANLNFETGIWSSTGVEVGAVVGAGVEVAAADNISLKAEGRYYAFPEADSDGGGYTHTSNTAVGLVGVNFHF